MIPGLVMTMGLPRRGTYADDYFNGTTPGEWSDDLNDQWFSEVLPDEGVRV